MNRATYTMAPAAFWIITALVLCVYSPARAQQDSQYTQYMYNTQTINPGYTATREVPSFLGLYRAQWIGLDGAPRTFNFSGSMPLGERLGAGLSFTQDAIGISDESTIVADVSYRIPLNEEDLKFSFGVKGGINLLDVRFSELIKYNPNDPQFQADIDNRLTPVIGAGAYLYTNKWYFGISVPNFLTTTHYDDSAVSTAKEEMNFYGMAGYVFDIAQNTELKPAVMVKAVDGAPLAIDVSANMRFNRRFTLGAAYRFDAAVSGLAGFETNNGIMFGYSYDYGIQNLGNYNSGSHEVFIRFDLGLGQNAKEKMLTPRFF